MISHLQFVHRNSVSELKERFLNKFSEESPGRIRDLCELKQLLLGMGRQVQASVVVPIACVHLVKRIAEVSLKSEL